MQIRNKLVVLVLVVLIIGLPVSTYAVEIGERFWVAEGRFGSQEDTVIHGPKNFVSLSGSILGVGPLSLNANVQVSTDSRLMGFWKLLSQSTVSSETLMTDLAIKARLELPGKVFGVGGLGSVGLTHKRIAAVDTSQNRADRVSYSGLEYELEISKTITSHLDWLLGLQLAPGLTGTRQHEGPNNRREYSTTAVASRYAIGLRYSILPFAIEGGYMAGSLRENEAIGIDVPYSSRYAGLYIGASFGF